MLWFIRALFAGALMLSLLAIVVGGADVFVMNDPGSIPPLLAAGAGFIGSAYLLLLSRRW